MWGPEGCVHLVVGGLCVAEFRVRGFVCVCDQVSA